MLSDTRGSPVTMSGRTRIDSPVLRLGEWDPGNHPAPAPTPDLLTSRPPATGDSCLPSCLATGCQGFCYSTSEAFLTDARLSGLEKTLQSLSSGTMALGCLEPALSFPPSDLLRCA